MTISMTGKIAFITYFNSLNSLEVKTRTLKNSEQISIRSNTTKKKKDFVISIYNSGTVLIQTIKKEKYLFHLKQIYRQQ